MLMKETEILANGVYAKEILEIETLETETHETEIVEVDRKLCTLKTRSQATLERGPERGLGRGLERGLGRGLERGLGRGPGRGLERGLARGLEKETGTEREIDTSTETWLHRLNTCNSDVITAIVGIVVTLQTCVQTCGVYANLSPLLEAKVLEAKSHVSQKIELKIIAQAIKVIIEMTGRPPNLAGWPPLLLAQLRL